MHESFTPHATFTFKLHDNEPRSFGTGTGTWPRTLSDSQTMSTEADNKSIDVNVPVLARFFQLAAEAGVVSMSLNIDGAKEGPVAGLPHCTVIECPNASWMYTYAQGYFVTLRGPLQAVVSLQYPSTQAGQPPPTPISPLNCPTKLESLYFDAQKVVKALDMKAIGGRRLPDLVQRVHPMKMEGSSSSSPRPGSRGGPGPGPGANMGMRALGSSSNGSTPRSEEDGEKDANLKESMISYEDAYIPAEPVNSFGIPQATMRCLEVSCLSSPRNVR